MRPQIFSVYTALCERTLLFVEKVRYRRDYRSGSIRRSRWMRYSFAVIAVALTVLFRYILGAWWGVQAVYILMFMPIILAALYGGMLVGIFTTFLAGLAGNYFFLNHNLLSIVTTWKDFSSFLLYGVEGILISLLLETLLYLQNKLEERARTLQESEDRFRLLIEGMRDYSICMLDIRGYIISWNRAAERLQGYLSEEIVGKHFSIFSEEKVAAYDRHNANLAIALREGRYEEEGWRVRKDGSRIWANVIITPLKDDRGKVQGFAKITRDITERKEFEDSMRYQAAHDALTGLPNRIAMEEQFFTILARAKRNKDMLAVLFLDLDRFKSINDTLGHNVGDKFLRKVAERLKQSIREEDLVARFGGDEFVILLQDIKHPRDAVQVAKKIIESLRAVFEIEEHDMHINTSIGIAMYPQDGLDVPSLLKNADVALYQAKDAGGDSYKLYTRTMNVRASERMTLENSLRQAIDKDQFSIAYQPIIDLSTGMVTAAEALIRWSHPVLGPIYPNDFIPLAEETGLIVSIDEWVIAQACKDLKGWEQKGLPKIRLAINLSARQFSQPNLFETIQRILREADVDRKQIELEITESLLMENIGVTTEKLALLKEIGVQSSIDDFGMGFSSLNSLKNLPIDKLKIDRAFVKHCTTDVRDAAIVKAIITMAHTLKLKVVAEGIETKEHLQFLNALNCDYGQGYFLSTPLPLETFEQLLKKKRPIHPLKVKA